MFEHKNIIILLKSFILGGAERQALALASHLKEQYDCTIYIYAIIKTKDPSFFLEECERLNLKNTIQVENPLSASGRFKFYKRRIKIFLFGLQLRKHNLILSFHI